MSIDLKQFSGATVKPADDARLYNFLFSDKSGVCEGVSVTHLGANKFRVSSGWGVIEGRMFEVVEETVNATLSSSGEVNGRLLINIDVSSDKPASFVTQAAATLPSLVQENINTSGTVYQFPLAEYKVNEIQCSSLKDVRKLLVMNSVTVDEILSDIDAMADVVAEMVESLTTLGETLNTTKNSLSSHTSSKNNPHGVTASQVGLDKVTNTKQMPIAGGLFEGVVTFANESYTGGCGRNILVQNKDGTANVATQYIIAQRK